MITVIIVSDNVVESTDVDSLIDNLVDCLQEKRIPPTLEKENCYFLAIASDSAYC